MHTLTCVSGYWKIPNKHNNNVPDPYYGTEDDFKEVFTLLMEACEVLIKKLK